MVKRRKQQLDYRKNYESSSLLKSAKFTVDPLKLFEIGRNRLERRMKSAEFIQNHLYIKSLSEQPLGKYCPHQYHGKSNSLSRTGFRQELGVGHLCRQSGQDHPNPVLTSRRLINSRKIHTAVIIQRRDQRVK